MDTLKLKKAWEMAIAPAKQLPMNAFGMYMSGNSLQIFSIMMVFMLFKGPIQALINIQNVFARFETEGTRDRLILVKLAYVACNFLALALGIWKVNGMGLLPYVSQPHLRYPYIANNQSGLRDRIGSLGKLLGSLSQESTPAQPYDLSNQALILTTKITNQDFLYPADLILPVRASRRTLIRKSETKKSVLCTNLTEDGQCHLQFLLFSSTSLGLYLRQSRPACFGTTMYSGVSTN